MISPSSLAEIVDRIIAYVNDDIITLSELNEKTIAFQAARQQNPFMDGQDLPLENIRRNVLENLIHERLAAQEISRLKINVDEAEVDNVLTRFKQDNYLTQETLEAQIRKEGKTLEDLRQQIRQELARNKLITREVRDKTVITDDLVQAYYESNLSEFQVKERWRLQDIFLPFPPQASPEERKQLHALSQEIFSRLQQGADFTIMAQQYSRGPGAEEGGDLGFFSKGELEPSLEKAIETLEPGQISPPVKTAMGFHVIKVTEVDSTPAKPFEEVQEIIRSKLYQRELNFRYREWLNSLRERSYVKVVF